MPIVYALIASGTSTLAEYSPGNTRFNPRTIELIRARVEPNTRKAYVHEGWNFNYVSSGHFLYLSVTDASFQSRLAFAFLERVQSETKGKTSGHDTILRREAEFFSFGQPDKIQNLVDQIGQVRDIMTENIESILKRGEKLEDLVVKTEKMSDSAVRFRNQSRSLKRAMWWQNVKLWIIIIFVVLAVIFFIVWGACGATFQKCRK